MQDNMIGPNPYNADCFAPRDRLTWLHIMAETTNLSDGDLTLAEQKLIARDTTPRSEDFGKHAHCIILTSRKMYLIGSWQLR